MVDTANLPAIHNARLPANYEGAKLALKQCSKIDECQDWADKAAALASYARQSEDEELQKMAQRIRARAIDRCGKLLREIEPATNQHDVSGGGDTPTGRMKAARDAGLSRDKTVTALRVANVPQDLFEELVESDNPPTTTQLAEIGKKPNDAHLKGRDPLDFRQATGLLGLLRYMDREKQNIDVDSALRGLSDKERDAALEAAINDQEWLYSVLGRLEAK